MADQVKPDSGVPMAPLRRADDLVGRIEALTAHAYAGGHGTIAYFLEMALIEARIQLRQGEEMDLQRSIPKRRFPER